MRATALLAGALVALAAHADAQPLITRTITLQPGQAFPTSAPTSTSSSTKTSASSTKTSSTSSTKYVLA